MGLKTPPNWSLIVFKSSLLSCGTKDAQKGPATTLRPTCGPRVVSKGVISDIGVQEKLMDLCTVRLSDHPSA